jgi:hypothetical protein
MAFLIEMVISWSSLKSTQKDSSLKDKSLFAEPDI